MRLRRFPSSTARKTSKNYPKETMKEVCATREERTKQRLKENTNKSFEANMDAFDAVVKT